MSELTQAQSQNVELSRRAFDAFNAADVETLLSMVSEEVEVFSSDELMNAGTYHGHEGFMRWLGDWSEAWEKLVMDVDSVEPLGDNHVVTAVTQHAKGRGGIELDMQVAFLFEARGGICTFLALLPDAERARELARERAG